MIAKLFDRLSNENRAALATFVTCGDPTLDFTEKLIERICASGADIVELGVPFSDPMADGKTIEESHLRALENNVNLPMIIDMAKRLRTKGAETPFVISSYFNPVYKMGLEKVVDECVDAKISAMLLIDVPFEESEEITSVATPKGVGYIPISSPDTSIERVARMSACGGGYLYYATISGITGERDKLPAGIAERLAEVRKASKLPVAAGLGISTLAIAHEAALNADAVVVCSKIVEIAHKTYEESGEDVALDVVSDFVKELAKQMKR